MVYVLFIYNTTMYTEYIENIMLFEHYRDAKNKQQSMKCKTKIEEHSLH